MQQPRPWLPLVATLLMVAQASAVRAEGAQLVRDINASPSAGGDSSAVKFVRLGDATYFIADDGVHGTELWRTGGTPPSTRLVADINPGRGDGLFATTLTVLRNQLYFAAGDTVHGCGLWKSDGTAAGTKPVYVFDQGQPCGLYHLGPRELTRLGQRLLFSADHPEYGRELWASDGTAAGTRLVRNINQSPSDFGGDLDSSPARLTNIGSVVLFTAEPRFDERTLWRTDGTLDGTYQISPVRAESAAGGRFAVLDGAAIFLGHEGTAPRRLWRSGGSAAGTYAISEVGAVAGRDDEVRPIVIWRDAAYFLSRLGPEAPLSLWRSDGTGGGTGPVVELPAAGSPGNLLMGNELVAARDQLFFTLWQGTANKLWRSDGTVTGTRLVLDLHPEPPRGLRVDIRDLTPFGDGVAFAGSDGAHGCETWISDGTAAGTLMLGDVDPAVIACGYADFFDGPGPQGLAVAGDRLFFVADDGAVGREPWTSDGTPAGTHLVVDVNRPAARTGDAFAIDDRAFDPQAVAAGDRLIFTATDGTARRLFAADASDPSGAAPLAEGEPLRIVDTAAGVLAITAHAGGQELWATDGTSARTTRLATASVDAIRTHGDLRILGSIDGAAAFRRPGTAGPELWRTDGTGGGTSLVADLRRPAAGSDQPAPAGALFFLDDGATTAMWYTDGTPAGTHFVTDLAPFASGGDLVRLGPWTFFRVSPPSTTRVELWRTDGSRNGTRRLADATVTSSLPVMDGRVFFAGFTEDERGALWASDGTSSGTHQIAPIGPSPYNAIEGAMVVSRGALLFVGDDGVHGPELWRSDGTAAGTAMLREIRAGARGGFDDDTGSSFPPSFTPAGDALVFRANDGEHGVELWRTDGTVEGTRRFTDIDPRAADFGAFHAGLTAIRGRVAFYAFDADTGFEPWITDGTSRGTRRLADVAPGPAPSRPLFVDWPWGFSAAGERLYFVADDGTTGSELWSVPLDGIAPPCPGDCNGGGTVTVDELVRGVAQALGSANTSACPAFDTDLDRTVSVDELVAAVRAALEGCLAG